VTDVGGPDPRRPRIFGVGLNKTATTTLHRALELLGFRSLHWGGPPVRRTVEASLAAGEPLLAGLDPAYDAYSDVEPLYRNVPLLDEQYPGSRFVLTVRPVDEWLDSRRRHVERNQALAAEGRYDGTFLEVDEAGWRADWDQHVAAVRAHFAGRADLLEVDLTRDPAWEPLSTFLGVAVPDAPFPWENRSKGS
jgi:hypothetical protein